MIIKSKYKIARRLGTPIYEKTQLPKFALRNDRRAKGAWRPRSGFGLQLLEKQKARLTYSIVERQFKKYVKEASAKKGANTVQTLFGRLEMRLDNVVYRLGFATTRLAAKQMVSHGHIMVGNTRTNIPSYTLSIGETISVRPNSMKKPLMVGFDERMKQVKLPSWLTYDADKKIATVTALPKYVPTEHPFNLGVVVEFYSR
jgi:small subunit ribosomal protein S4